MSLEQNNSAKTEETAKLTSRGQWRWMAVLLALASIAGGAGGLKYRQIRLAQLEQESLQDCKAAASAGEWSRLQQLAETWLRRTPTAVDAWVMLGEARSQQQDPLGAAEALSHVPDDSPKVVAALLFASDLQFGKGNRPLDGVRTLQRLIARRPDLMTARQRLLYFYAVTHQREPLLVGIQDAIAHQAEPPDVYIYLMLADHLGFSNGLSQLTRWLSSASESEVLRVALALQHMQAIEESTNSAQESPAEREARLREFAEVEKAFPENPALFRYRCERAIREFDVTHLGKLLAQAPMTVEKDSVTWRYRGWHSAQTGNFDDASSSLKRSLELFPMDWHTWQELANVERRLGRLEEAERAAKLALEGKELRKAVVQLPDVRSASTTLLRRIGAFAEQTGQTQVAIGIQLRLDGWGQSPGLPQPNIPRDPAN